MRFEKYPGEGEQQLQDKDTIMLYILKSRSLQWLSSSPYLSYIDNLWVELMHDLVAYFKTRNINILKEGWGHCTN